MATQKQYLQQPEVFQGARQLGELKAALRPKVYGEITSATPQSEIAKRRRMIFPLRVLGSVSVKRMSSGLAKAPISLATHFFSSSLSSLVGGTACSRVTKAQMACPLISSGRPTTAASATLSWATSADSTSIVLRRCPETLSTSSTRP